MTKPKKYVVWLSSEPVDSKHFNSYGYYSGKMYRKYDLFFPCCSFSINEKTKLYSSEKRAENALKAAIEKFEYVVYGKVETVGED
mgnify:CR=1 FL=1